MLTAAAHRDRSGFSLTKLIVAIALFGVLAATLTGILVNQQRLYVASSEIIEARSNVRQAADILPSELRGISPARGDIYAMSAMSIEFRLPTGSAVACEIDSSRTSLTIPPQTTSAHSGASAWLRAPEYGDSLLIYDHGATNSASDDAWRIHALAAGLTTGTCSAFTSTAAEAALGHTLSLASPLPSTVASGASIRFFRRARYELYDAANGQGYLGFSDCLATRTPACSTKQPVSGPYIRVGSPTSGLLLSYFDSSGASTADPRRVARIDVTTRARSRSAMRLPGRPLGDFTDSLSFSIATRN